MLTSYNRRQRRVGNWRPSITGIAASGATAAGLIAAGVQKAINSFSGRKRTRREYATGNVASGNRGGNGGGTKPPGTTGSYRSERSGGGIRWDLIRRQYRRKRFKRALRRNQLVTKSYLRRVMGRDTALQVIRVNNSGVMTSANNSAVFGNIDVMTNTIMGAYSDDIYRYNYDDVSSTMERIAPDISSMHKAGIRLVKGSYMKFTFRNNTTADCTLKLWAVTPKNNTNVTPLTSVQNGLTDIQINTVDTTDVLMRPWDSPDLKAQYRIMKQATIVFAPGDTHSFIIRIPPQVHSFDYQDAHGFTYRRNKSCLLMYQLRGCIAHDSGTTSNVGYMQAQLDYVSERVVRVKGKSCYNEAPTVNNIENLDSFPNAANVVDKDDATVEAFDL